MNAPIRTVVIAFAMILLVLGAVVLPLLDAMKDLPQDNRDEELRQLAEAISRGLETRRQAVQEWIAQDRTLAQTMQRFRELDEKWPDYNSMPRNEERGADEERLYQHIHFHVRLILRERPAELTPMLRRLEKEYRELHASGKQAPSIAAPERMERSR